jgi:hypothetical protein
VIPEHPHSLLEFERAVLSRRLGGMKTLGTLYRSLDDEDYCSDGQVMAKEHVWPETSTLGMRSCVSN